MKIEGRCRICGRAFPIDVLLADPQRTGRCPFCGEHFDIHYGALLVESLKQLEQAGTVMQGILERTNSLGPALEIDAATVLEPIREALRAREVVSKERRATEEAAAAERTAAG